LSARLHVLLGAGGVGKTTLAAAYALSLARERRVGLLGIDPARRLQDALGFALADLGAAVPGVPLLQGALLRPEETLRRWAAEACPDLATRSRLLSNPFFVALADRLAASTDVIAAVRMAEWAESDSSLSDLVVDTAPGLNAIEFLSKPEKLTAFLQGRLVAWLRWLAREGDSGHGGGILRSSARRVLDGLARIGGTRMLLQLAEFLALVETVITRMMVRLEAAQQWLRQPDTELLVVTTIRSDAVQGVTQMVRAVRALSLEPRAVVVNRALPSSLGAELQALKTADLMAEVAGVLRYARAAAAMQSRIITELSSEGPAVVQVRAVGGLDTDRRLESLAILGDQLRAALGSARVPNHLDSGPIRTVSNRQSDGDTVSLYGVGRG
jgi:anion-transporting  ArsA/GET3 family ATPase